MSRLTTAFRPASRLLRATLTAGALAALAACAGDGPSSANPIAGTYVATVFTVVPEGTTNALDIKASGGSLTITIAEDNASTGQLFIPKSLTGDPTDFVATMTGTAVVNGSTLTFTQLSDTFVRDLTWTVSGRTISVTNQLLMGDRYTIVLTR
jgi:type IV secretory pathway protease TraF